MQNKNSLIAPISSLHRYLAEANNSILNHPSNEKEQDRDYDMPSSHFHNLSELGENKNDCKAQAIAIDQ